MLVDLPFRFDAEPLLWTVPDVYTETECAAFITRIERPAPGLATNNAVYRDQDRVIVDDVAVADELFGRLRPHLPERMGVFRLVGLNERLRCAVRSGVKYAMRTDVVFEAPDEIGKPKFD